MVEVKYIKQNLKEAEENIKLLRTAFPDKNAEYGKSAYLAECACIRIGRGLDSLKGKSIDLNQYLAESLLNELGKALSIATAEVDISREEALVGIKFAQMILSQFPKSDIAKKFLERWNTTGMHAMWNEQAEYKVLSQALSEMYSAGIIPEKEYFSIVCRDIKQLRELVKKYGKKGD